MKVLFFRIDKDVADLLFRILFSLIFLGLGMEHLFSDELLQLIMPDWVPFPRMTSILCGVFILFSGACVALGLWIRQVAVLIGIFLVLVTFLVHVPAIFYTPDFVPSQYAWLWEIFQRSNLVTNLCLLGVCFQLLHHDVGRFCLEHFLRRNKD